MAAALDIALDYIGRGWNPVPVNYRAKKPNPGNGWQKRIIDATNAPHYFNNGQMNVGVILGPSSHGLTDVDLDCDEARAIASYILPRTGAIFGRASSRAAHWLYYTDLSVNADRAVLVFKDPTTRGNLLELRIGGASGAQTVFPGSTHKETGEAITWEESGEPASVDNDDLYCLVHDLAAYALIARHWPAPGLKARHDAALTVGGFLARTGRSASEIKIAAEAIARAVNDPEWRNRREAAEDAAKAFHAGKHAYGITGMRKQFGDAVADQVAEWLGYDGNGEPPAAADEPPPAMSPEEYGTSTNKPAERIKLPFLDMSRWDADKPPMRQWALHDRLPLLQTSLFSGEGGGGKSISWLQECYAHAIGRDWLGMLPEPGGAWFVECEDDEKELHRRARCIADYYETPINEAIKGGFRLISFAGRNAVLATVSKSGKIEPTPLYNALLEEAGDIKPKMIGIASSANVFAGNENDRGQVQQFIGMLTRIAMAATGAVSLISHPSLTGINSDSGLSGTTQWHNAVRARFYMRSVNPEPGEQPDSDLRELVFKKNNYGPIAHSIVLRYQRGLFLPVPGISSLDRAAGEQIADGVFLDLLKRFTKANRNVSDRKGPGYAPAQFAREDEAKRAGLNSKSLETAMRRLFKAEKIENECYGRPSRLHYRIALKT
jgi:RecA-family ATPase